MIAEGQIDQMLDLGKLILADDPENLNVLHALAFQLRQRELLASPRDFTHATEAVELSRRAIGLVESGKTLAGVENFDKNATLAWLYQNLAIVESRGGMSDAALKHYEKSTSFAPLDPDVAGRNLAELLAWRQVTFNEAVNAYNALPAEARGETEPSAEVTAARDALNAEADALIDVSARFMALAEVKNLPQATRDRVYAVLESAYKTRHPDDAEAAGLQAVIDTEK